MPIDIQEKFESRGGDGVSSHERRYVVFGSDDENEAIALVRATAPLAVGLLRRQPPQLEPLGPGLWDAKVHYCPRALDGESGTAESSGSFCFDTTGGTQHITQSKATVGAYIEDGSAASFGGAIGVSHDKVEGVDITVPVFSFTVSKVFHRLSQAYIAQVFYLTGKTNDAAWAVNVGGVNISFAAGEVLFLGASGQKRIGVNVVPEGQSDPVNPWELSFKFAASPNATGLTIGSIGNIEKRGWDYLWVRYEDAKDEAAKTLVKLPQAVYVERVYEEGNFALLGL